MTIVIPGPGSLDFCKKLSDGVLGLEKKVFSDGEVYVRVPKSLKGEEVLVVSRLYPCVYKNFFETLLILDACDRADAERVLLFVPYLVFSRQDKVFLPGEPLSSDVVLDCFRTSGCDHIITFDCHFGRGEKDFTRGGLSITNLSAFDLLTRKACKGKKSPLFVAPDKSMRELLSKFGEVLVVLKERDRKSGEVSAEEAGLDASGRDVVIVDDLISSGGTIALAAEKVMASKPKSVTACCTHGLFCGSAIKKMKSAGVSVIFSTDTIVSEFSKVSVAPILKKYLKL